MPLTGNLNGGSDGAEVVDRQQVADRREVADRQKIVDRQEVLPATLWRATATRHADRVQALTLGHAARARAGRPHPVEDFLFSYYSVRPGQLKRWHPGAQVALADAPERAGWRFHRAVGGPSGSPTVAVDPAAFKAARSAQLDFIVRMLSATAAAQGQFGCFGLHEWAMVYRQGSQERRHAAWPLRLGQAGSDDVVREHQIRCTHYDAFRFFTPDARPRNTVQPDLESRLAMEQPGCLHAGMDTYKWAYKMIPVVPSELLLDCFELARSIRELDMRASPYDLSDLGYPPVAIETAEGKVEYVAAQRRFAQASQLLRGRLLEVLRGLPDTTG